jgi:hypothetical protein
MKYRARRAFSPLAELLPTGKNSNGATIYMPIGGLLSLLSELSWKPFLPFVPPLEARAAVAAVEMRCRNYSICSENGSGFGDPDARRNAEQRLQMMLAGEQQRVGNRINWLTFFLVVVGLLNAAVLSFQVWGK